MFPMFHGPGFIDGQWPQLMLEQKNIGTQGVQELFFVNWKISAIAKLNRWHVKCFIKQTTVRLTRLQININISLFSNRQFDSFFDTTHTVIGVTCANAWLPVTHRSHKPFNPRRNFCSKTLKLKERFAFYTSRKFTRFTKQHYFTRK